MSRVSIYSDEFVAGDVNGRYDSPHNMNDVEYTDTQQQTGEVSTLTPISFNAAMEMYETAPEKDQIPRSKRKRDSEEMDQSTNRQKTRESEHSQHKDGCLPLPSLSFKTTTTTGDYPPSSLIYRSAEDLCPPSPQSVDGTETGPRRKRQCFMCEAGHLNSPEFSSPKFEAAVRMWIWSNIIINSVQ